MKVTSAEITTENVPTDLSVPEQGVMPDIPASEGSTNGSLTVVVREAEPKRGFYSVDGTKLADITLSDLKKKIGDGTALSEYGLGAYFYVPYTDPFDNQEYSCKFRFGHFGQFTWEDWSQSDGLGLDCADLLPTVYVQFDSPEPSSSNSNRKRYGNNRYKFSNLRKYMNSSGTGWYEAQHAYDAPPTTPSEWNSVKGLLDCFPSDFVDSLDLVQIKAQTAYPDNGVVDTLTDLFFLQSVNELGYARYDSTMVARNVEGEFWSLYKELSGYSSMGDNSAMDTVHDWLVKRNIKSGNAQNWLTRSARLSNSSIVWCVLTNGGLNSNGVYHAFGFAPACVLRAS